MAELVPFDRENLNEDVERMRALWVNEMNAPEVLQYDEEMVSEMLDQIRNQQEYVDSVYEDRAQLTDERAFINKLYQMEIDRLRYMVSSYLRTRLRKASESLWKAGAVANTAHYLPIEKFAMHMLADAMLAQRLSPKEREFARQFVVLFENHMQDLALGKLAEEHQSLSTDGMVPEPDLDSFVFCESKGELPNVQCDDRGAENLTLRASDRLVLRYRSIQPYVADGQAALI